MAVGLWPDGGFGKKLGTLEATGGIVVERIDV
jgi:hypothetical protein